jgi:hypothetical protein
MANVFLPDTPLEHAVRAGDYTATVAILRQLSPPQRQSSRASARRLRKLLDDARWASHDARYAGWGMPPTDAQLRAANAALVVCGTANDVAESHVDTDDLVSLGREFSPPSLQGLAEAKLAVSPYLIGSVQQLIVAGLVPRPDGDEYVIGLISLPRSRGFDQAFASDPGLGEVLLRVMAVEGTSECNLAAIDKYSATEHSWSHILRRLCVQGVYSRETLLDRTLAALERDWPQFRSGWFSRFHGELEPDLTMMAPHARRYLALCHSRIPPTVTLALDIVKQLDAAGLVDDASLFEALHPVVASSVKGQVTTALKLIDKRVRQDAALATTASGLVAVALAHESAELQAQVLQRLAKWGVNNALRARLTEFLPSIAAANRLALEALLGPVSAVAAALVAQGPAVRTESRCRQPMSPLDASRRLLPPEDADALVACIAHVFENDTDIAAFEMACTALVQAVPLSAAERDRLGPVLKRAPKVRTPVAQELARLLVFVADGNRREMAPVVSFYGHANHAQLQLAARTRDWMEFAAQGARLPPLSAPTHRYGFIDAGLLVERTLAHQVANAWSSPLEQVRALLRISRDAGSDALAAALELRDTPFTRALRYALGDDIAPGYDEVVLFAAASRIRHPGSDDAQLAARVGDLGPDGALTARYTWHVRSWTSKVGETVYTHHRLALDTARVPVGTPPELLAVLRHLPVGASEGLPLNEYGTFGGSDEGLLRFSATLIPSCLEAHFADGARAIGNNIDWWQAQWPDKVYLERLLDPAVAMTPMATLLLALGLGAKEPGQNAIAVDALIACHAEGRLDVVMLASTIQVLAATPLTKCSRYAKSIRRALQLDSGISPVAFRVLCSILEANSDAPPRDAVLLLELIQEVTLANGYALPAETRSALQAWKLGGRARTLQKALVA